MISIKRLEKRIDEMGLNPYSTAKKAGLGPDYVRDLLRGKVKQPSAARLRELAIALNCSPEYLMGVEDEPGEKPVSWRGEKAEAVRLGVEYRLRDGYFESPKAFEPQKDESYWVVSVYTAGNEWLEAVEAPQLDGLIPPNTFVHVLSPEHHFSGLTNLFVVETRRDNGKLIGRKIRRSPLATSGDFRFAGHYDEAPLSWEEAVAGREGYGRIVGCVLRYYRFFDAGVSVDDIPF
jgi:transcriptional regulator with XRE-family HTH domain